MINLTATLSVEQIKEKVAPLFEEEGLQIVLLFGSVAQGRIHKESDIDLAFLFEGPVDILALTNRVTQRLGCDRIDVVDLRRASPLLKFSAARDGRLLYESSPGLFNAFCSLAFRMYSDTKKLRDAREKTVKDFLEKRGVA